MKGLCLENFMIYKATLRSDSIAKNYFGYSETEFKICFHNHTQSFKYRKKCNVTELSKTLWHAKDAGKNPFIQ